MRGSGWFGGRGPPVGMGLGVSGRHPLREWWILARNAMNHKSMDVFSLRDSIVGEYRKFATSFTTIRAEDIASCRSHRKPDTYAKYDEYELRTFTPAETRAFLRTRLKNVSDMEVKVAHDLRYRVLNRFRDDQYVRVGRP
jgi:hypothetical protein